MDPIIILKSFGAEKNIDIIQNIFKGEDIVCDDPILKIYKIELESKYYKVPIALVEIDDLNSIPQTQLSSVEGCIFYMDLNDESSVYDLKEIHQFVKRRNIGIALLFLNSFSIDSKLRISMKEVNDICKNDIDVIDLNENEIDNSYKDGYEFALELLRNNIWSNVPFGKGSSVNIPSSQSSNNSNDIEEQLNDFEKVLNSVLHFKDISQNFSREEVLSHAEKIAESFVHILNED